MSCRGSVLRPIHNGEGHRSLSLYRNPPATRYADTGAGFVGYQVFGDGPRNIIFRSALDSNADAMWDSPAAGRYFDRLSGFGRVLYYDWRGTGISDPMPSRDGMTWDALNDDALAAMRAAEMDSGVFIGDREGGPAALLFAATYPEKVDALILVNTFARFLRADDYPIGATREYLEGMMAWVKDSWGTPAYYRTTAPSIQDDTRQLDWLARYQRMAAPPSALEVVANFHATIDVRSTLPLIQVPTLVVTRADATHHRLEYGRYLAAQIPHAVFLTVPGGDTAPFFVGDTEPILDAIEEFVTGSKKTVVSDRVLATVMFTDIVDSTRIASELGDDAWLDALERHNRTALGLVEQYRGHIANTTGDGILATFDGPTRGVACASELVGASRNEGLDIRVGLHTGEVEFRPNGDVAGLAVHIAARVTGALPGPGVIVSSTVHDLVGGTLIPFLSLGPHELKGAPEPWNLFQLANPITLSG